MNAQTIGLIFKENGKLIGQSFDLAKACPLDQIIKPQPAGPFLVEATLESVKIKDKKVNVAMLVAVNDTDLHVMMREIPIFTKLNPIFAPEGKSTLEIKEPEEGKLDYIGFLKAKDFPKGDFFYFKFRHGEDDPNYVTALWDSKDQRVYTVPFHNFHTDGQSCLPEDFPIKTSAFTKILAFLNSYTSPHFTYEGGGRFDFILPKSLQEASGDEIIKTLSSSTKGELEMRYGGVKGAWPRQSVVGAFTPPPCLQNITPETTIIGKLQPMV